jgi:hypothetical protein
VPLLVYAPIDPGNLRRQHLRLQLDVDFFSSRLHAKLIHYMLMNYVSEDFSSFVDANKFVDVDEEGKLCEASVKRGTEYRNTVQKEYCTFVLT